MLSFNIFLYIRLCSDIPKLHEKLLMLHVSLGKCHNVYNTLWHIVVHTMYIIYIHSKIFSNSLQKNCSFIIEYNARVSMHVVTQLFLTTYIVMNTLSINCCEIL